MHDPRVQANLPRPAREWRPYAVGVGILLGAVVFWLIALTSGGSSGPSPRQLVLAAASAPPPAAPAAASGTGAPAPASGPASSQIIAHPSAAQQRSALTAFERHDIAHVSASWMAGFYPLYETASQTFGVNWLLLASIHKQETAFSTAPSTYHGLNFAHCCGGPMQFNVTNRPVTTWELVSDSYRYGARPASYPHATLRHPSIYDDFDSIMAAARLLAADGAGARLDAYAWNAAYDYYGHDATGVAYADDVLARAITWSQKGFCINCSLDQPMVDAVHGAYGAPVLTALLAAPPKHPGAATAHAARRRR